MQTKEGISPAGGQLCNMGVTAVAACEGDGVAMRSGSTGLNRPGRSPPEPVVSQDAPHFSVEEAVGQRHCEPLSGEKDGPEVYKEDMGGGGGVARPQDGDDVGDAQQWDDHQQSLCRFPVLMISRLTTFSRCSQLRHNHGEDGDEEEHVGSEEQEDGPDVNPLQV